MALIEDLNPGVDIESIPKKSMTLAEIYTTNEAHYTYKKVHKGIGFTANIG